MGAFRINTQDNKIRSVNRTIRIKAEHFDQLTLLSEKNGVSFNRIINQCIDYALENLDEEELTR